MNRISEVRKQSGMNQSDLAQRIGISTSAIGMYEQGRRDPDTQTLLKIAQTLDVSVDYLVGASDVKGKFDIEAVAEDVAGDLINNPALMFSADCYTEEELADLQEVIKNTVRKSLIKKLKT